MKKEFPGRTIVNELNELVVRLTKKQPVKIDGFLEEPLITLQKGIACDYVHVRFKDTGTELGIKLDRQDCNFNKGDFENATGSVHLVGGLILNYNKVRCVANINLDTCEGTGYLEPVSDEEYDELMGE